MRPTTRRLAWRTVGVIGALLAAPFVVCAQAGGPSEGTLVLVGGGAVGAEIAERFIALAGGPDASIVVIPTAAEGDAFDEDHPDVRMLHGHGARNVTVLHTRDRDRADTEAFVAPIRTAGGVWFGGGRQWRLADAYLGTRTEDALWALLDRDGVIGGTSAGATIQGEYLVRGDTQTNTIMMGDHEEGFGFLRGVGVDQHLLRRNRQFDLIEVVEARPDLLGIGLDEGTAIVVEGDAFEVVGDSYVAVYDAGVTVGGRGRFYLLAPGDRFDLPSRTPSRPGGSPGAAERIEAVPWSGQ